MSATVDVIDRIESQAKSFIDGHEHVQPGQPFRLNEAASVGDGVWQGDLGIEIVEADAITKDYTVIENPKDVDLQLVPGNTEGSKHCLDSFDGVTMYRHKEWGPSYDGLAGPILVLTKERTIKHPKHGDVSIAAGFTVRLRYQRELDAETKRERRNAD